MTSPSDGASVVEAEGCDDRCEVEVVHAAEVRAARARLPAERGVARAVETAGLLANPTRLRILAALCPHDGEAAPTLCVCDLSAVVGASETGTSHQLRSLRLAGLVEQRRDGRLVYYRLADDPFVRGVVVALVSGRA